MADPQQEAIVRALLSAGGPAMAIPSGGISLPANIGPTANPPASNTPLTPNSGAPGMAAAFNPADPALAPDVMGGVNLVGGALDTLRQRSEFLMHLLTPEGLPNMPALGRDIRKVQTALGSQIYGGESSPSTPTTAETPAPEAGPAPRSLQQDATDFIQKILGGSGSTGARMATSTAEPVSAQGQAASPLSDERQRIQDKIDKLATLSTLPQETFRERLVRLLVGTARGYSAALMANGNNPVNALGAGLAQGSSDVQAEADRISAENQARELQNKQLETGGLGLETKLYGADAEGAGRAAQANARILAAHINANSRLMAAEKAKGPDRIHQALEALQLFLGVHQLQDSSRMDNVLVPTASGTKVPIGSLPPTQKLANIAALQAPTNQPQTYNAIRDAVDQLVKNGKLTPPMDLTKQDAWIRAEVHNRLVQFYLQNPQDMGDIGVFPNVPFTAKGIGAALGK